MLSVVVLVVPETHPSSQCEEDLLGVALGLRRVSESVPVCVTGIFTG